MVRVSTNTMLQDAELHYVAFVNDKRTMVDGHDFHFT